MDHVRLRLVFGAGGVLTVLGGLMDTMEWNESALVQSGWVSGDAPFIARHESHNLLL